MGHSTRAIARRWHAAVFIAFFSLIICTPGIVQMINPRLRLLSHTGPFEENRVLARPPPWPDTVEQAIAYLPKLEPYLGDRFGLRTDLITLNNYLRFRLFGEFTSRQIALGRNGRVFLTSHDAATPFSMIRGVCGIGVTDAHVAAQGVEIHRLLERTRSAGAPAVFLVAPTASALSPQDMPTWLARQCEAGQASVPRVAAAVPTASAGAFLSLLSVAQGDLHTGPVVPWASFHWWGNGAKRMVEAATETLLGRTRSLDIPMLQVSKKSDLSQFMPGLGFMEGVQNPDWRAAGIEACHGRTCFDADLGPIAGIVADASHYRSRRSQPGRLLVLSDSFGAMSVGYFAAYFTEVRHFSMNDLERLSAEQIASLRHFMFAQYKPDQVVYLFHDGAILFAAGRLNRLLWQ